MLRHPVSMQVRRPPRDALRTCAHDLRNLFAVVASAKSLLERPLDEPRMAIVLDGLARVAVEGKIVTDALLRGEAEDHSCGCDTSTELQDLAAIIRAYERPGRRIELAVEDRATWVLMAPPEFRAVVLELVTNAAKAGATRIRIVSARRGCRCWLSVSDDGCGFVASAGFAAQPAGLHGTGLRRLKSAVDSARGKVRIKSKPGVGTVIAMILPIMRVVTTPEVYRVPVPLSLAS